MRSITKVFKRCSFFTGFLLLFAACNHTVKQQTFSGYALGTTYTISYFDTAENARLSKAVDSVFYEINKSMSTYLANSDISKINRGDSAIKVDAHFVRVLEKSVSVWKNTRGYFDPTVGALVNAYGFGPGKSLDVVTPTQRDSLLSFTGLNKVVLTPDYRVVREDPRLYIDFNAIAKGYTVDVLCELMEQLGYQDFLVEIGGELRTSGFQQIKKSAWKVAIDHPEQGAARTFLKTLSLSDKALATSGNYRKFSVDSLTGERFVHTLNPHTGTARPSKVLSASVVADNCMTADAYATALMAMPLEYISQMDRKEFEYFLVLAADNGDYEYKISPGFQAMLNVALQP
jgi:thiamine biosynthesis lipoprotein